MTAETLAERAGPGAAASPEVELDDHAIRTLLDLARDAAHEVERPAAPLTTFLVGVAVGRGATLDAAAGTATVACCWTRPEPPAET